MPPGKPRRSKDDWLRAALATLEREGVHGVRVERLARDLGVAKSGFYWHFRNRDDLLVELVRYWREAYTEVVSRDPGLRLARPKARLRRVMEMVVDHDLARWDVAMRSWAGHDPEVAKATRRVYRIRLDFVRDAFAELGFEGDDLEMRTRLFVCYQSWERATFTDSRKALRRFMDCRLALLTRK